MNIFVSRPTVIEQAFENAYTLFHDFLKSHTLIPRRLGQTDYSRKAPLKAVFDIIDQCQGAIILGYPQMQFFHEVKRSIQIQNSAQYIFPTPWNQIEGALVYRAEIPVLVIAQIGVNGGIFDHGVTGERIIHANLQNDNWFLLPEFSQTFKEWLNDVKNK